MDWILSHRSPAHHCSHQSIRTLTSLEQLAWQHQGWGKAGNIQAEIEAIESLDDRDRFGDSKSDGDTGPDIKKAIRTKMLHILRMLNMTYIRNNRKQNEQQTNPDGMPTEQIQHIHRHLDGGPHRLQKCQPRLYLGPSTLHTSIHPSINYSMRKKNLISFLSHKQCWRSGSVCFYASRSRIR